MIEPTLDVTDLLTAKIKDLDKKIVILGEEMYPETKLLRQIPGVGPITSLAFVLIVGDPERFANSRDVRAYFGLVSPSVTNRLNLYQTNTSGCRPGPRQAGPA